MIGDIQLGSVLLPATEYRKLTEGYLQFEVGERTINNTYVSDFIDSKKTFTIEWNCSIDETLMQSIIDLYTGDDITVLYTESDGTVSTYICHMVLPESWDRSSYVNPYSYDGFSVYLEEV